MVLSVSPKKPGSKSLDTTAGPGSKISIGIFHPWALSRDASGLTVYTRRLSEALSERTPVYLYAADGNRYDRLEEAPLEMVTTGFGTVDLPFSYPSATPVTLAHHLNRHPYYAKFVTAGMHRHIEEHVDIVVTHDYLDELFISNVVSVPTVRILHGQPIGLAQDIREKFTNARLTLANSEHTARNIKDELGYCADGIVPPGVDVDTFNPDVAPAFREEETSILYTGRLVEGKGIFDLLDALAEVTTRFRLHLVGRGQIEQVMKYAVELGIRDGIVFHGTVPNEDLPQFYVASDIFCNPSHYESFGIVNVEAMSCKTPVICTDLDGTKEYASHNESAIVVPPGDSTALAQAIEALVESEALRNELASTGRTVAKNYSWEASAERLQQICSSQLPCSVS